MMLLKYFIWIGFVYYFVSVQTFEHVGDIELFSENILFVL